MGPDPSAIARAGERFLAAQRWFDVHRISTLSSHTHDAYACSFACQAAHEGLTLECETLVSGLHPEAMTVVRLLFFGGRLRPWVALVYRASLDMWLPETMIFPGRRFGDWWRAQAFANRFSEFRGDRTGLPIREPRTFQIIDAFAQEFLREA